MKTQGQSSRPGGRERAREARGFAGWVVALLAGATLSACDVEPYCLRCPASDPASDGGGIEGGMRDASTPELDGGEDGGACLPSDAAELCNEADDDCDGVVDEGFDLATNPRHCGRCARECRFSNAEVLCAAGECSVRECFPGFADLDDEPGCETMCPVFPVTAEACNGLDDDCDGVTDETLPAPPADLCRATPGTPCAGAGPICATREGRTTWFCNYAAGVEHDPALPNGIALEETACDGVDGDCDGRVDEPFTELGTACDNGLRGACRDVGAVVCDPADPRATRCDLSIAPDAVPGAPLAETCNGVDDDCDGTIDDADPSDPGRVLDDMVHVARDGLDFWVYRYEASRPDASAGADGVMAMRACSKPGVRPWTRVGWADAAAACAAAGHRLCTGAEWLAACEGQSHALYPYGATYSATACNGADRDAAPGAPHTLELATTGALPMCESEDGAFDLSGNVKEWTADPRGMTAGGTAIQVVRGGSYESPELGLTCDTDLSRATVDTILDTLGFRCCRTTAP